MSLYTEIVAAETTVAKDKESISKSQQTLMTDEAYLNSLLAQQEGTGLDVSEFNGNVEWTKVKEANYKFAFVRCADGNVKDANYGKLRVESVRGAGMTCGVYYFGHVASPLNDQRNGREEAGMAIYFAREGTWGHTGDLPLVYDFEEKSMNEQTPQKCATHIYQFVIAYKFIENTYPIIYTNPNTWNQINSSFTAEQASVVAKCPLWIANWNVTSPQVPYPWTEWTFWQWTNEGAVPGITGKVDLDRFSGTTTQFEELKIK